MSSSDRRTLLGLLACLALAACQFVPAYGPAGPARALMGGIEIDDPRDRNGFDLVGRLQERLGQAESARWRLSYAITAYQEGLGITSSNAITRYNVIGSIDFTLRDVTTDATVAAGRVQNFTSYSASGTVVSTAASERDAYLRLMRILADQIVTELIASAPDWAQK